MKMPLFRQAELEPEAYSIAHVLTSDATLDFETYVGAEVPCTRPWSARWACRASGAPQVSRQVWGLAMESTYHDMSMRFRALEGSSQDMWGLPTSYTCTGVFRV